MKKRFLSVMLALAMVFTIIPTMGINACAEGNSLVVDSYDFEEFEFGIYTQVVDGYTIKLEADYFGYGCFFCDSATIGFADGVTKITKIEVSSGTSFGNANNNWIKSNEGLYYLEFTEGSEPTKVSFNVDYGEISSFTIYYKEGTGVKLSESETDVFVGDKMTLTATTIPAGNSVKWSSSDEGIARLRMELSAVFQPVPLQLLRHLSRILPLVQHAR